MGFTTSDQEQELHVLVQIKEDNPKTLLSAKSFMKAYLQRLKMFEIDVPNKATRLAQQLYHPNNGAMTARNILDLVKLIGKDLDARQKASLAKEINDALKKLFRAPATAAQVVEKGERQSGNRKEAQSVTKTDAVHAGKHDDNKRPAVNGIENVSPILPWPEMSEKDATQTVTASSEEVGACKKA